MKRALFIAMALLTACALCGCGLKAPEVTSSEAVIERGVEIIEATTEETPAEEVTEPVTEEITEEEETPTEEATEPEVTVQPVTAYPIGIYIPDANTGKRTRLTAFTGTWEAGKDLDCFETILSNAETMGEGKFAEVWQSAWETSGAPATAKIGYALTLNMKDGTTKYQTVCEPSQTLVYEDWVQLWLYDDINQNGWYSHLEGSLTADTDVSSVKLTAGTKIDEVESMELETFLYEGEADFDSEGKYKGASSYSISINRN